MTKAMTTKVTGRSAASQGCSALATAWSTSWAMEESTSFTESIPLFLATGGDTDFLKESEKVTKGIVDCAQ